MGEIKDGVLALIPARGGSKGLPGKNTRPLHGIPLIGWSIQAARGSRHVSRVVVSSEDVNILQVAREQGAETPFVRPAELAQDETPGMDVVLHALAQLPGFEWIVLLQPTSPLRQARDIDAALELCLNSGAPACVSVRAADDNPWWMFSLAQDGRLDAFLPADQRPMRRQDLPSLYALNGAIYAARTDWLQQTKSFLTHETVGYVMPPERSVDIDTLFDFRLAECLASMFAADDQTERA